MSPQNHGTGDARRKRLRIAIATSNAAGAVASALTQALISDPTTSVAVGTFVAGTTADVLLQRAIALEEPDPIAQLDEHGDEDDELGDTQLAVRLVGDDDERDADLDEQRGVEDDEHRDADLDGDLDADLDEHGGEDDGHLAVHLADERADGHRGGAQHDRAHRQPLAGHGYARCACTRPSSRVQRGTPAPQREMTTRHLRHRQLHRGAQRFVQRVKERLANHHGSRRGDAS